MTLFDELNGRHHEDVAIEESDAGSLRLWVGDCCMGCNPSATVVFHGVTLARGLEDFIDDPHFRLATDDERDGLDVAEGAHVVCIDRDGGPPVLIVASGVAVELHPVLTR